MFFSDYWESICRKCGLCCYEKELLAGCLVVDLESPCKYLNTESKLCEIYKSRLKENRRCKKINLFTVLFSSYLPANCSYVEKFRPKWLNARL